MINLQQIEGNITCLSFENRERDLNLFTESFLSHLETLIEEIIRDKSTQGIIFTSSKNDFHSGTDLTLFLEHKTPQEIFKFLMRLQKVFREIERWGKPVVSAISGSVLGCGLELALSSDYRVAINHHSISLGFPEIKLGLMPGAGGCQRLLRLIGPDKALTLLLSGEKLNPKQARAIGLIDLLVETKSELIESSIAFIEQNQEKNQIAPNKKFWHNQYSPLYFQGQKFFSEWSAKIQRDYRGQGLGAQRILSCLYEGSLLDLEPACKIEAQSFAELFKAETSQRMIKTLFFGVNRCKELGKSFIEKHDSIESVAIIGSGVMGVQIAQAMILRGINAYLVDRDLTTAEIERNQILKNIESLTAQEGLDKSVTIHAKERIKAVATIGDVKDCHIFIEAVDELVETKKLLYQSLEECIDDEKIIISNTSSLPLELLSQGMKVPERLVGLHFFAPATTEPLVEIVKSKITSQKALISALKLANQLDKTPIVVRDSHGFFTTRVMVSYILEAILCLKEGIPAPIIENAGRMLGFPVGPLELADKTSLTMISALLKEKIKVTGKELDSESDEYTVLEVLEKIILKHKELDKKGVPSFYDYHKDKKILSELTKSYTQRNGPEKNISIEDIKKRLINIQLVETMKCYEEGVLNTAHEGDVASLLGWGFPAETGGIVSHCHQYGNEKLLEELSKMSSQWGSRFLPPKILKTLINKNYQSLHEAREILASALLEDS